MLDIFTTATSNRAGISLTAHRRAGRLKNQDQKTTDLIRKYYANQEKTETRMWSMPNLMVALPNIGGALCSTPQSLADAHY